MSPDPRNDPYLSRNFLVQIGGVIDGSGVHASFTEVSGLGVAITPVEYRAGGDRTVRRIPGGTRYSNVTLKRGVTGSPAFWDWMRATLRGEVTPANVSIQLLNETAEPVLHFKLFGAWPVRFEGPHLRATGNDVAIEVLELCHERLELE